jgi:enoyl-CoA hydratase
MEVALIKVAVADAIAVVTMDNPPVNAQNPQFNAEMAHVFDTLSDRKDARVAVLTGAGKVFSAGADMKGRARLNAAGESWQHKRRVRESFHAIRECALLTTALLLLFIVLLNVRKAREVAFSE